MDPFRDARVLVTGGAGFIGSHVVDTLVARGADVAVIDDFSTGKRENLAASLGKITLIESSILSERAITDACVGAQFVVHLAAFVSVPASIADPAASHETNVTGTLHTLLAARGAGVRRFVYASSSAVYGFTEALPCGEDQPYIPESPYAAQKVMGEGYARLFSRLWGFDTVRLRFFNVYGPRQNPAGGYAAVIPAFISRMKRGEAPVIFGDGAATRDFTYVGDVVNAILLSLVAPDVGGGVFNIASGIETSVTDLARSLAALEAGAPSPVHAPPREGDIIRSVAAVKRAEDALGFRAVVPLAEGLRATHASY
ncbi:MAG: NAD-dependent epimerase/dehydratase family protein [Patescibacteria group bacterium]